MASKPARRVAFTSFNWCDASVASAALRYVAGPTLGVCSVSRPTDFAARDARLLFASTAWRRGASRSDESLDEGGGFQVAIRANVKPGRTPANSPCLKPFHRPDRPPKDPLLDEFLVAYERAFGSRLRSGFFRRSSKGADVEIDAEGPHVIVEVKTGKARGVFGQVEERFDPALNPHGKVVIALIPSGFNRAAELCRRGILVATSVPQAIAMIRDLEADPEMRARLAVPGGERCDRDLAWLASFGMMAGRGADTFERRPSANRFVDAFGGQVGWAAA